MRRFACAFALALTLAGAGAGATAHGAGPVRLVVGVAGALDDPVVQREIDNLQYPTLTALGADTLDTIPGVAEAWVPAPDGWTYTIRAGAAWSNGTPVTADDVVSSLERQRDRFPGIVARAVDDRSVTVAGQRDPGLLLNVVPRDPASGAGGDWQEVERDTDHATLRAVDRPGRPRLDEIVFRSYPDAGALLGALDRGDVDVAGTVPRDEYARLREIDGVTAIHASDGDQWILRLRIGDAGVRRAIARAIDRDELVAAVAGGVGRTDPIPIVARGRRWQLDPEVADPLAGRLSYDPEPIAGAVRVSIAAPGGDGSTAIVRFVTGALSAIGIEVGAASTSQTADITVERRDPGDDPAPVLDGYRCTGDVWCDARYDAAYETFASTSDTATRVDAAQEMVKLLATEAVEVVLFEPDTLQGFRTDNVSGLLREPRDERLVVFWPSIQQYYEAVPTSTLGGEEIPDSAFAGIAAAVTAATIGLLAIPRLRASGRRRRGTRSRP